MLVRKGVMRPRPTGFLVTLALGLLAVPRSAEAQQAGRIA